MHLIKAATFAEAYSKSLFLLRETGAENSARGTNHTELLNVWLEIEDPASCLYTNARRSSQTKYIAAELLYYYSGRNDAQWISKYAKMWEAIKNPDGTINSAYGNLIFTERFGDSKTNQYEWAIISLVNDSGTRQAVMHFNNSNHQKFDTKDFVCTMYGIFHIRQNRLNLSIFMRSNDAILGTPTDVAFFCSLQMQALKHLREYYPELEMGTYSHHSNSYHIYEQHYELVDEMLAESFDPMKMRPVVNNMVFSNGNPTPELKLMLSELDSPSGDTIIFQDDDLMHWIWGKLAPKESNG